MASDELFLQMRLQYQAGYACLSLPFVRPAYLRGSLAEVAGSQDNFSGVVVDDLPGSHLRMAPLAEVCGESARKEMDFLLQRSVSPLLMTPELIRLLA